ncbi:MAG TPA: peptidoglycan-binding domain-containing protein [Acidobacteriaceae bacterium]|nr:peptidoglycan-binding domain-containing protein [Acidobacteriaceae bacterium]
MVSLRTCQVLLLGTFLLAGPAFAARTHKAAVSSHHRHHLRHRHEIKGQREIEPERAREIQQALIREHYLTPPASGQWDSTTEAAMQKFQADHGWQTKLTPDSRALIKLGLGPGTDGLQPAAAPVAGSMAAPADATADASASPSTRPAANNTLADAHTLQN